MSMLRVGFGVKKVIEKTGPTILESVSKPLEVSKPILEVPKSIVSKQVPKQLESSSKSLVSTFKLKESYHQNLFDKFELIKKVMQSSGSKSYGSYGSGSYGSGSYRWSYDNSSQSSKAKMLQQIMMPLSTLKTVDSSDDESEPEIPEVSTLSKAMRTKFDVTSPPPEQVSKLAELYPPSSTTVKAMTLEQKSAMAEGVVAKLTTKSQVSTDITPNGSHKYTHLGGLETVSDTAIEKLVNLNKNGSSADITRALLTGFPGIGRKFKAVDGKPDTFLVTLTSGAIIEAKIEKIPLKDGRFALGLQAQTTKKHPLRGLAQWMLIVDPSKKQVSFSVLGTGKHPSETADKMNNQIISCGFWDATQDGVIAHLEGKALKDPGRHSMFKALNIPNVVMGRLNQYLPSDPEEVA